MAQLLFKANEVDVYRTRLPVNFSRLQWEDDDFCFAKTLRWLLAQYNPIQKPSVLKSALGECLGKTERGLIESLETVC